MGFLHEGELGNALVVSVQAGEVGQINAEVRRPREDDVQVRVGNGEVIAQVELGALRDLVLGHLREFRLWVGESGYR